MKFLRLVPLLLCFPSYVGSVKGDPVEEAGEGAAVVEEGQPERRLMMEREEPPGPIRLDGLWEIHVGGRNTGVEVSIKQVTERFHATFSKPPANNPYGIQVGDQFLWGTVEGRHGDGNIFLLGDPEEEGGAPKKEQAPAMFRVSADVDRMRVQVNKENLQDAMKRFELVRTGKVESLRLYVNGPGELQSTVNFLEDQHMVIEVKHSNAVPHPVDVKITSGTREITLRAEPLGADDDGKPRPGLLRTEPFVPTFSDGLGVQQKLPDENEEVSGRAPTREDWQKIAGSWKVLYKDGVLGDVSGWIDVNEWGKVQLRYEQPGSGMRDMEMFFAKVDGETSVEEGSEGGSGVPALPKFSLMFGGVGVISDKIEKPALPESHVFVMDPQNPSPISLKAEDFEAEVELVRRDGIDFRKVTLELDRAMPGGSLLWNWHYRADRTTGRDLDGFGRAGTLVKMPGDKESTAALSRGREVWMKDGPKILAAFSLDNQMAMEKAGFYGQPVAEYRLEEMTHGRTSGKNGKKVEPENSRGPSGNQNRHIFIVAKGLPPKTDEKPFPDLKVAEGSGVEYYRIDERGRDGYFRNSDDLKKAWAAYHDARRSNGGGALSDEDKEAEGLLVLAVTDYKAEPGPQPFVLAESEGEWNLLYGDIRGTFMIGRELAASTGAEGDGEADEEGFEFENEEGEWEAVTSAFAPERLHLVVDVTHARKSIPSLKTTLALNGKIVPYGKNPEKPEPILLTPDPNDPTIYRSPPIHLVLAGHENNPKRSEGDLLLKVKKGDKLKAMVQQNSGFFIEVPKVQAVVQTSPSELNALWKDAVKRAADLAGQPVEDWNQVLNGTADSVTNFIFVEYALDTAKRATLIGVYANLSDVVAYASRNKVVIPQAKWMKQGGNGGIRSIKISIGDHAAMLLLRDEFVKMMNEQWLDWSKNKGNEKLRSLFESQKQALAAKQSPLSFIKIPLKELDNYEEGPQSVLDEARLYISDNKSWWLALDAANPLLADMVRAIGGSDVGRTEDPYLYQLFDNNFLGYKTRLKEDGVLFEQLQWNAFKHAHAAWGPLMWKSINHADKLSDGDVAGLRKLTGIGFEPVIKRLVPKMMKLETDAKARRTNWVPDHLARAHIKSLGVLGAAAKAQEEYSETDTTAMMAAISVATIPLGGGGFWSSLIAASVSAADFAYTVGKDVIGNEKLKRELEFEIGAGGVLGANRAADKESKILSDLQQAFSVAGSALGLGVDGAAFAKAARSLKTATVIEESGRLLREVDFANPAALRSLSKQDKALLAEAIRRGDELAKAGRFGEIPEEFLQVNRNRKSILEALDGSEEFSSDAVALARRRGEVLAESNKQPNEVFRSKDFDEADEALRTRIESNKSDLNDLQKQRNAITEKYPDDAPPPRTSDDGKKLSDIDDNIKAKRDEIGDLSQRRGVIDSYQKPKVKVPKRQAETLRGEGPPPSRAEFEDIRDTRNRVREGRPPTGGDDLETVDLDAAGARIDDLKKAAQEKVDGLVAKNPAPGTADAKALQDARAKVDDFTEIRNDIDDLAKNVRSDIRAEIPKSDADLLRGKRTALSEADRAEVVEAIIDAEGDWGKLLDKANGSAADQNVMQKVHQWRREQMDEALTESMREVEDMLGLEKGALKPSAFGSTNLTSDYDISINPPVITGPGRGPELVVRRFQEKTRKLFGGRESGAVVDTNVYTDPVYAIFKGSELEGEFAGVTAKQLDTSRQFLFQQMANAKYRTPQQWQNLRKRILDGVPEGSRKSISDLLDQTEGANELAKGRLKSTLESRGITDPTEADLLRANNDLYADALETIDGYKNMIQGLKKAGKGEIPASEVPLPGFLQNPKMKKALNEAERLMKSGNPELAAKGREMLDELSNRAILNARNKQGEALYYAPEAYQTEATINHVVKEMQKPPKKVVTAESIMSGNHNLKPPKEPLSPDDYMNSHFENGANLMKELNAKKVLDESGGTIPGHKYNDKAATKASKYFVRQLDAASMAKLDMNGVKVPGFPDDYTLKDLVEATVELEANRSNMAKFKDVLGKYGMTGEEYLDRVLKAQDALDGALIGRSSLPGFANDLRAAEKSAETAASKYFRKGGDAKRDAGTFLRPPATALGKEALNSRQDFQKDFGEKLEDLDNGARAGRLLTEAQRDERARLQKIGQAQDALEQAVTGARLGGVPAKELESLAKLDATAADPQAARQAAAARLNEAAKKNLSGNGASMNAETAASVPKSVSANGSSMDMNQLKAKLEEGGDYATVIRSAPVDAIGSHLSADRVVYAKVLSPTAGDGSNASWVKVSEATGGQIVADDPVSGEPMSYSPDLFSSFVGNDPVMVVRDPYRSSDGKYKEAAGAESTEIDLSEALPLPDGVLVD